MADEEAKDKPAGDQEALQKLDWNSHGCKIFIQILVVFAMIMLGVAIIARLIRFGDESSLFFYFWTLYLVLFIVMLVLSMFKIQKVLMYFTFLSTRKGVGMFLIFIGSLLFDWSHYFELSVAIVLMFIGGLYIFYGFKVGEEQPPEPKKEGEEEKKQDRRGQYEEGKGGDEMRKRQANQHVSPPSYQPRGGEVQYQRDGGARSQAPGVMGAPPDEYQPHRISDSNYPPRDAPAYQPRDAPAYQPRDDVPSYQPRDGGPPVRHEPQYDAAPPGGYQYDEEEDYNQPGYGGPPSYQQDTRPPPAQPQRSNMPPPPDEAPMEMPQSIQNLKKFKDINDLLS